MAAQTRFLADGDHPERAAEVPLLLFSVEGQRYGLHVSVVQQVLPMVAVSPLPRAPDVALGVFNLHGEVIPVLDIRRRFGLPLRAYGPSAHMLVVRTHRRTLSLPVDEAIGVQHVSAAAVTPAEAVLPRTRHVAGIVALADGLLFIHDLDAFLSLDEEERLDESLREIGG